VVGDGDAVGIGAEIAQHVFWTTEGRLGIDDHPAEQYLSQDAKFVVWRVQRSPWNSILASRKAFLSAATNLPRNTRLSTLTGRKKEWWEEIHERGPERGRQRRLRCEHEDDAAVADPRYGARLKKPISAPR